jgi:hypothetical protein
MKSTLNFTISLARDAVVPGVTNKSGMPSVGVEDFNRMVKFCLDKELSPELRRKGPGVRFFSVQCAEDHPFLPSLMNWLNELGWIPWPRVHTPDTPEFGYFPIMVTRIFSKQEANAASHLWLLRWGSISASLAPKWDQNFEFCGFGVRTMSGRWSHDFLEVSGLRTFAVSEVGREILQAGGLKGLIFRDVEWDLPKKAKRPFFLIDCERTMPPCLLPVVEEKSETRTGWYLDGPYEPPILQFSRSRMNDIANVDAAWTAESLRPNPKRSMNSSPPDRSLIVSAKFFKVLSEAKVKNQSYPVKWVDGSNMIENIPPFLEKE